MSDFLHRVMLEHRPLWMGLGVLVLAVLDLMDPALLAGMGVLVAALTSEIEA